MHQLCSTIGGWEMTERNEEYSIFTYYLRPAFDFQQELFWNGEDLEVLEPLWLRKEIAGKNKEDVEQV